jgi:hypothetical protein
MSTIRLHAGAELHNMSPDEFRGILREQSAWERADLRAIKEGMRFPYSFQGTASGGVLQIGETQQFSPNEGYVWSIRRLVVNGLTAGTTPDIVNLYLNDAYNQPEWQFNGNAFGYGFGRGELTMNSGHVLLFRSVGTFAATGTISIAGQYDEFPAEKAARMVV